MTESKKLIGITPSGVSVEWTKDKTLLLISEYCKRPGLWDMTHEDYRKKDVKKVLLEQVSQQFNCNFPTNEIEKKFHTLRTQYHREVNRMGKQRNSNNEPYKSKWFAFKHLQFLSSPNACRTGRSTTIKVKLEKKEEIENESIENVADEEIDKQSSTKYVIRAVPYTETILSDNGPTVQNEFITAAVNQNNKSTSTTLNNCTADIEIGNGSNINQKQRNKAKVVMTRKELQSLIEDATKQENDDTLDISDDHDVIIKEVSVPIHNFNNQTQSMTEHRVIQTGINTFETQPDTEEHEEIINDNQHLNDDDIQNNDSDQDNSYSHHQTYSNQMKIVSLKNLPSTGSNSSVQQQHQKQNHHHNNSSNNNNNHHQQQQQQHHQRMSATSALTSDHQQQHNIFEEVLYEDQQQQQQQQQQQIQVHQQPFKKVCLEKVPVRDEFTIFGEYVANELRFLTSKDILITAKHKINVTLFEASTSQLNRTE